MRLTLLKNKTFHLIFSSYIWISTTVVAVIVIVIVIIIIIISSRSIRTIIDIALIPKPISVPFKII